MRHVMSDEIESAAVQLYKKNHILNVLQYANDTEGNSVIRKWHDSIDHVSHSISGL